MRPQSPLTVQCQQAPQSAVQTDHDARRTTISKLGPLVLSIGMALLSFVAYVYAARRAGVPPSNYWPPPLLCRHRHPDHLHY